MKEAELKRGVFVLLSMLENQGKLIFQRNNSFFGSFSRKDGSQGFIRNNKPGTPDFYVFLAKNRTLHLELKGTKGKLSEHQVTWSNQCKKLGHIYEVVTDIAELEKLLAFYLTN